MKKKRTLLPAPGRSQPAATRYLFRSTDCSIMSPEACSDQPAAPYTRGDRLSTVETAAQTEAQTDHSAGSNRGCDCPRREAREIPSAGSQHRSRGDRGCSTVLRADGSDLDAEIGMSRHDTEANHATADNLIKAHAVLWIMCDNCDRQKRGDLPAIVARGLGRTSIKRLKFKCDGCGSGDCSVQVSSASADRFRQD